MTQLVVTLKDQSYLPNIRRIVKSLQGVESVSTTRKKSTRPARKTKQTSIAQIDQPMAIGKEEDPLEALEAIGRLVRSTGKSSEQLIDGYLQHNS